jgi:hypothetical protein
MEATNFRGEIGVIGYGSLMNDEGNLRGVLKGAWMNGQLKVPLGLYRLSQGRYSLTRVIDPRASLEETRVCLFQPGVGINAAIKALREREGISESKKGLISYINFNNGTSRYICPEAFEIIYAWGQRMGFKALVWTELPANIDFQGHKRSVVIEEKLMADRVLLQNTKAYIRLIPEEMRSALEKRILRM